MFKQGKVPIGPTRVEYAAEPERDNACRRGVGSYLFEGRLGRYRIFPACKPMAEGKSLEGRPMTKGILFPRKLRFQGGVESPEGRGNTDPIVKVIEAVMATDIFIAVLPKFRSIGIHQFVQIWTAPGNKTGLFAGNRMRVVRTERTEVKEPKRCLLVDEPDSIATRDDPLVEVPESHIEPGIPQNLHSRKERRPQIHPLLINGQPNLWLLISIPKHPLHQPPNKSKRLFTLTDANKSQVESSKAQKLDIRRSAAIHDRSQCVGGNNYGV